ncbi:hypothetical protein MYAM1_003599 [Malassezia yamatoensis]|uniref:Urea transporter n=1 Tax=Malassezia yamatoensis TaxID=253288 RepID=A0AAJ6CJK2_9BASI|nr:hypothetical protein MYAM1_003599 [Malassezia yamatoensis]
MVESPAQVLGVGVGWAVVVGLGFAFAGFMLFITYLQNRFTDHNTKSLEEFNSASRSVKPGLVAAGIVSAWTWAATLLQSTVVTYNYGVSGAYWYAAGASLQIMLCAIMACKIKTCAPFVSTFLEVVRIRYGKKVHCVFIAFALVTNLLVSSQLVLGGAAVVTQLTGLHVLAGLFLIPTSVAVYTVTGGLRATFIADYSHTLGLFVVIMYFFFHVWTGDGKIGGLKQMSEKLDAVIQRGEGVVGNAGGSYLTMRSKSGLIFGVTNICGNLATVFCDQSYHQRSIASLPTTAARGFLLGGSAWFPIPFLFATTMGLAARALVGVDSSMAQLSESQVSAGLPAPSAAVALCGKGGAVAVLILLFLAVTSATSAQQIAVSSVFTYDIYKVYLRRDTSGKHIELVSHAAVCVWALIMAIFGLIWHYAGISLGWLYLMMGIIVAPAVFPIFGTLTWNKTNPKGCVVGMLLGLCLGVLTWLVTAYGLYKEVSVTTTNAAYPTLAGNLVSICVSTIITVVWSLISPQNYTFAETRAYNAPEDALLEPISSSNKEKGQITPPSSDTDTEGNKAYVAPLTEYRDAGVNNIEYVRAAGLDPDEINATAKRVIAISVTVSLLLVIVIPAIAASAKVWKPAGLGAWVWLGFLWLLWSVLVVGILPLWEARAELAVVMRGIVHLGRKDA